MSWEDDSFDDDDDDYDNEELTVPCTNCSAEIYLDADICPHCGEFQIDRSTPLSRKPNWYVALALAGIVAVIAALLFSF